MELNIKNIYTYYGQYDKVVNIILKEGEHCFESFGRDLTGIFHFSKRERTEYEEHLANNTFPKNHGTVKFKVLLKNHLSREQIDQLNYEGIHYNCISSIFGPNRTENNEFSDTTTRMLPKPLEVNFSDDSPEYTQLGFYQHRINNSSPMLESELDRYAALTMSLKPEKVTEEFTKKYVLDEETGQPKLRVLKHKLFIDAAYMTEDKLELDEEEKSILDRYSKSITSKIEKELLDSGITKKEMYNIDKYYWLYHFLCKLGLDREDEILLFGDPLIYLDFKGLLHVFLRHVDILQVGKRYKGKTTFVYAFKDVEQLLKYIIDIDSENIERHFAEKGNVQYRNKGVYFQGDYYTVSIAGDGRIQSIHKN